MAVLIIIIGFTIMLVTASFAIIPYVTRRTESFGVSIPESEYENPDLKDMRSDYVKKTISTGIIFVAAATMLLLIFGENAFWITFVVLADTAAHFLVYYGTHKKMKEYKAGAAWKGDVSMKIHVQFTEPTDTGVKAASPLWFALFAAITAINTAVVLYLHPTLPDMTPMFMPGMLAFMSLLFVLVYLTIVKSKRKIDPENPAESAFRVDVFRAAWINFTIFAGLLLIGSISLMHLAELGVVPLTIKAATTLVILVTVIVVAWSFVLALRYGQGGSRINRNRKKGTTIDAGEDDRYWKAGIFYFNKDDPSLFVEKRFGVGFTFNMARPSIWLVVAGIVVFFVVWTCTYL